MSHICITIIRTCFMPELCRTPYTFYILSTCIKFQPYRRSGVFSLWCHWCPWTSPIISNRSNCANCFDSLLCDATAYNWLKRVASDPVDVKKLNMFLEKHGKHGNMNKFTANIHDVCGIYNSTSTEYCTRVQKAHLKTCNESIMHI